MLDRYRGARGLQEGVSASVREGWGEGDGSWAPGRAFEGEGVREFGVHGQWDREGETTSHEHETRHIIITPLSTWGQVASG